MRDRRSLLTLAAAAAPATVVAASSTGTAVADHGGGGPFVASWMTIHNLTAADNALEKLPAIRTPESARSFRSLCKREIRQGFICEHATTRRTNIAVIEPSGRVVAELRL